MAITGVGTGDTQLTLADRIPAEGQAAHPAEIKPFA